MLSLQSLREGRVVGPCWEKLKPKGPKGRRGPSGIARGSCLRNEAPHLDSLHLTFVRGRETGILLPNNQRQQHLARPEGRAALTASPSGQFGNLFPQRLTRRRTSKVYTLDFRAALHLECLHT